MDIIMEKKKQKRFDKTKQLVIIVYMTKMHSCRQTYNIITGSLDKHIMDILTDRNKKITELQAAYSGNALSGQFTNHIVVMDTKVFFGTTLFTRLTSSNAVMELLFHFSLQMMLGEKRFFQQLCDLLIRVQYSNIYHFYLQINQLHFFYVYNFFFNY